jgi:predicted HicB family RNase H-like nuclease
MNQYEVKKDESLNKTIRMPSSMIKRLEELAQANDISFNKLVIQCVEYALENMKEPK